MRRTLLLVLAAASALAALWLSQASAAASPADPASRPIDQPDGTTFEGRLYGDERLNGVETEAGFTVVQDAAGVWTFAEATPAGRLRPTGIRPGASGRPPADTGIEPHLRDEVAMTESASERAEEAAEAGAATPAAIGTQDVLVIRVGFADQPLATDDATWSELFFGPAQSVADYYDAASYGQLDLVPAAESSGVADDGVVTVELPTHPDSGASFAGFRPTARAALAAVGAWVDLTQYDDDQDGRLSPDELHLVLVVAGTEAAQGCDGPSIWAHRAALGNPVTVQGIRLGDAAVNGGYTAAGELQCDGPLEAATLGIWVHELGHDLGWLDLYDVDGSSAGVDTWSVMGLHWLALPGERSGANPPLPDPFSRWQVGWVAPHQVTTTETAVPLQSSATTGDVVQVLDNPDGVDIGFLGGGGTGEYFLVENRRQEGYDSALVGCGVLVWHIDETKYSNADDDGRLVDLEAAGAGWSQDGYAGEQDPWPSTDPPNDTFGPRSVPDSSLNSGLPTGASLSGFSGSCTPTATVDVDPGGAPVGRPVNDRLADARVLRLFESGTTSVRGHNVGATHQPPERPHQGARGRASVWYSFRPPRAGYVEITSESTFREAAVVYTGPHVGRLTRVESVRGVAPGAGGVGSPPAPESFQRGLGFRVERNVRYLIAVDSRDAGVTGGFRLFLDYDQARPDVRPVRRIVAPGQRPEVRVQIRNTATFGRLRVYRFVQGTTTLRALDCPSSFVLQPGTRRTCRMRVPATGRAGADLRGKVTAWIHWMDADRYSSVADPWFARVGR